MAEIILPPEEETPQTPELNIDKPTTNSKVITIEFEAKKTNKVSTKDTNQQLYTTDTDAWFEFKETSLEGANGTYSVVFRNRHDGSIFQRTGDVVNGVAYYKIPHQEIRHAGAWRGQIVYTLSNGDTTAREFDYDVKGHILDGKDVREIVVEDFETLMAQLRSMKDNAELELADLKQELENIADTAEQNETDRQAFFNDLVEDIDDLQANYQELLDTGVLQTNINEKLEQLEEEYAPKLTEVTAHLAQNENKIDNLDNEKADKNEVNSKLNLKRDKNKLIGVNDFDGEILGYLQDGVGGATINVESVPKDNTVTEGKTTFAEKVILSDNLYDLSSLTPNKRFNVTTGELEDNPDYSISDYIKVKPNTEYTGTYSTTKAEYRGDKSLIKVVSSSPRIITSEETEYIRIMTPNNSALKFMFNEGSNALPFEEYKSKTKISNLILPEEEILAVIYPNGKIREGVDFSEDNVSFLQRSSPNLFNKETVITDKRLSSSNLITDDVNNAISDYIKVKPNTTYSVTEGSYTHYYDDKKEFISGHGVGIGTFTTTEETTFIRITVRKVKLDKFMLVEGSVPPLEQDYTPYDLWSFTENIQVERGSLTSKHEGKRFGFLGDSIVENEPYFFAEIKKALGLSDLIDYGIGGTSYAERGNPDWDDKNLVKRVSTMDSALDGAFVLCGTNDFSNAVPLGDFEDRTESTFYGALHLTFSALLSKYPLGNVYVLTMPPRYNQTTKIGGVYVHDFVRALKEVGAHYSIPVLDILSKSQARPWIQSNKELYYKGADGLHPNELLYDLILDSFIPFANAY